jgi:hypothetical protein
VSELVTTIAYPWSCRDRLINLGWRRGTPPRIAWVSVAETIGGDAAAGDLARCCSIISAHIEFGAELQRLAGCYREHWDAGKHDLDDLIALIDEIALLERDHAPAIGYAYRSTEDRDRVSEVAR